MSSGTRIIVAGVECKEISGRWHFKGKWEYIQVRTPLHVYMCSTVCHGWQYSASIWYN